MKKVWTIATLTLAVCLLGGSAWAQKGASLEEWTGQKPNSTDGVKASWASSALWMSTSTARKLSIVTNVKGAGDDTIRLFSPQSAAPRYVVLLTDTSTSSATPMANRWSFESIEAPGNGLQATAAYDINGDGYTDLFAGRAVASPYRIKRYYWTGSAWNTDTTVCTLPGAVNDMALGDADNDGSVDDIIATSGQVVFHVHWNGAGFDTTRIWAGDASTCYGVAIGDFDADHAGNEVVAVTYGQRVMRLVWNGATWDTLSLYSNVSDVADFYEVAVGDFDASNPGEEIAVGNSYNTASFGSVVEVYGSGNTWNIRAVYTSSEGVRELAIGDFLDENPGAEIVIAPYTSPYNVRAIYGSGDTWAQQLMFSTGGTSYGAAVGNVDQYRSNNDEVAITGAGDFFEAEQYWPATDIAIKSGWLGTYPLVVNQPCNIWARAKNNGTLNPGNFNLYLYINGSMQSTVNALNINPGESLDVFFPPYTPLAEGPINITIHHTLTPDEVPGNDTLGTMDPVAGLTRRFHDWGFPANTYKAEGFEYLASYPPAGWVRINNDGGTQQWSWFTSTTNPRQIHSGRLFTANRYETSSLRNDDWLVTDAITIPTGYTDTLSFYYRASNVDLESLEVWAMNGQTVDDTIPGGLIWAGQFLDTLYQQMKLDLGRFAGQSINIGFRNRGLYMWYIFLDDISWARYDALPSITYTSPDSGATGVLVNAPVVIGFSEPIDTTSFVFTCVGGSYVWDWTWNAACDTVVLNHNNFLTSTEHLIQVNVANDLAGNPLAAGAVPNPFTFTTSADGTPPTASVVSPAWGATDVPLNEPVIIAFSEPMNTGSINGYSTPTDPWSIGFNAAGDTMTLTTATPLNYNALYHVIATAGTDLAGYNLVPLPDTIAQFTTIANQGPQIEMVLQPGDSYDGAGPFLVRAVITDPAKSKAGVATDTLWYTDNATNWWTITHSAVSGDTFDFSIPGPIAPGTVIEYFLGAWDDQGDVTYTPGMFAGYQFRILNPLAPTALEATAGDMMVQLDWAPPAQVLAYDGSPSNYWNWSAGDIITTRFTPQHYPCKLEQSMSIWFDYGAGVDSIEVHVWPDDGTGIPDLATELVTPFMVYPVMYPNWTIIDLSTHNVIVASGDFHIGYVCQTTDMPTPVSDNDGPGLRTMVNIGGVWGNLVDAGVYYDFDNQAAVTYGPYTKGLALKSYHPRKSDKPLPPLAGLKANPIAGKQAPVYPELKGALAMAKNITGVELLRGDAPGGPYTTSLGTTTNVSLIDASVSNGSTYYYVARAVYSTPDTFSAFSNEDTVTPAAMPILLVDDDCSQVGWPDRQAIYTSALDGAGYSGQYTVYETDGTTAGANGPAAGWFANRSHVVWFSGGNWEQSNTLTVNDEANLAAYLDAGGRLFYSAQDYIWDRYPSAGAFSPGQFPYDYLGLASVDQDAIVNAYNIAGVAGSLAEGLAYGVIEDPEVGTYADDLTKRSVAGTYDVLDVTAKVGEKTGVAYDNGAFRTVFFTTLFEDITDGTNTKAELMYRILNWLSTGVEGEPAASAKPTVFSLANNYPNPVRTNTTIKFGLPKDSDVRIEVFNIAGQKVRTLANGKLNAGYHQVSWRGANENGQKVAAGVYLVRMVTPEFTGTRKMTVLR